MGSAKPHLRHCTHLNSILTFTIAPALYNKSVVCAVVGPAGKEHGVRLVDACHSSWRVIHRRVLKSCFLFAQNRVSRSRATIGAVQSAVVTGLSWVVRDGSSVQKRNYVCCANVAVYQVARLEAQPSTDMSELRWPSLPKPVRAC